MSSPSKRPKRLQEPLPKRELTTREKIILLEGSKLHGSILPPWKAIPEPSEFALSKSDGVFVDDWDFRLSDLQKEAFAGWQRSPSWNAKSNAEAGKEGATHQRQDLVQDVITDCSVVASLCAVTARTERGHNNVLGSSFFPFDHTKDAPLASDNGKYVFRFYFNGCYRRVTIDDRLPASKTSRALHVIDRNDTNIYWPALVEKAYLKVRGGYDFPGSNSGTDLWVLSGWVPEQLFLQSDDVDREALWQRISKAFGYGDVLVTMGTGKLSEKEERGMGLIGEHDYAVIDIREMHGQQLFLVKNPWSIGQVWKGHISNNAEQHDISRKLGGVHLGGEISAGTRSEELSPGTFWMPLNDIFQSFESIYLNWNPGLFAYREEVHFKWDLSDSSSTEGFLGSNPQYAVQGSKAGLVWIVLNRHFARTEAASQGSMRGSEGTHKSALIQEGFISLFGFQNSGDRVFLSTGAVVHSPYVDSPNALLKYERKADEALTIALCEHELPRQAQAFTLSVFSLVPVSIAPVSEKYTHSTLRLGAWTATTSGGDAGSPDYRINPQYSITLSRSSDVFIFLQSPAENWPVHVKLIWANGKQAQSVTTRDIVGDSGEHRRGYAFAEVKEVQAGIYTIVCSTFKQGQLGKFKLHVGSTSPCHIDQVAVAAAGRFITNAETAVLPPGEDRWLAPLSSQRLNRLSISAKSCGDNLNSMKHLCSPFKISIELGQGPTKHLLAVSGRDSFMDARHVGISTPDVDILPVMSTRGLWVVLERLGCSGIPADERVDVQVLSDGPCEIGTWRPGIDP